MYPQQLSLYRFTFIGAIFHFKIALGGAEDKWDQAGWAGCSQVNWMQGHG